MFFYIKNGIKKEIFSCMRICVLMGIFFLAESFLVPTWTQAHAAREVCWSLHYPAFNFACQDRGRSNHAIYKRPQIFTAQLPTLDPRENNQCRMAKSNLATHAIAGIWTHNPLSKGAGACAHPWLLGWLNLFSQLTHAVAGILTHNTLIRENRCMP